MPQWGWILIFWFLFLGLSNLGILAYGELEFWLSLCVRISPDVARMNSTDTLYRIKVIALIVFFILAICISSGGDWP